MTLKRLGLLAVVWAGSAGLVGAQEEGRPEGGPRGGGFRGAGGGMSPVELAMHPELQGELSVTDEQKNYLKLLREESQEEDRTFFESLEGTSREERGEKMRAYMEKRRPEMDENLTEILGEEKFKRLQELRLQLGGVMMLMRSPDLMREVGVTEDQQNQMREAMRESFGQMRDRMREGGADAFNQIRTETETKVLAILTDPQKERWNKMLGAPASSDLEKIRQSMFATGRGGPGGFGPRGSDEPGGPRRRRPNRQDNPPETPKA